MKTETLDLLVKFLSISTLFSLGAEASIRSLKEELENRTLWLALGWSTVLFPVLVWLTGSLIFEDKDLLIGVFLGAASAGGSSAGIFVKKINGNKAFSGSLLISQAIVSAILVPLSLVYITQGSINSTTSPTPLLLTILLYQFAPFIVGITSSTLNFDLKIFSEIVDRLNAIVLTVLIGGFISTTFRSLLQVQGDILIFIFSINLVLFFARPLYRLMGDKDHIKTASVTIAIRNLTTALFISSTFGLNSKSHLGILIYGLFMYIVAALWIVLVSRRLFS